MESVCCLTPGLYIEFVWALCDGDTHRQQIPADIWIVVGPRSGFDTVRIFLQRREEGSPCHPTLLPTCEGQAGCPPRMKHVEDGVVLSTEDDGCLEDCCGHCIDSIENLRSGCLHCASDDCTDIPRGSVGRSVVQDIRVICKAAHHMRRRCGQHTALSAHSK